MTQLLWNIWTSWVESGLTETSAEQLNEVVFELTWKKWNVDENSRLRNKTLRHFRVINEP